MLRPPPKSTLFPTRRSSDLVRQSLDANGIRVEKVLQSNLPPVLADEQALTRALENLYRNAVDAMPVGGTLAVDRKSTRLNSSHSQISYAVFCLKKKK